MASGISVETCWTAEANEQKVVETLRDRLGDPPGGLILLYVWPDYDLEALGEAVRRCFRHATVAGCTTAGHVLDGHGYGQGGIAGLSLASPSLQAHRLDLRNISGFGAVEAEAVGDEVRRVTGQSDLGPQARTFAMLLIDGLAGREEVVASSLNAALNGVPLLGGSAADAGRFVRTCVWTGGGFRPEAAALVVVHTTLPHRTFSTHHFDSRLDRLVVTDADATQRIVRTIDGRPAAHAYADATGLSVAELTPARWGQRPLVVKAGGQLFVRSIREVLEDGALRLYCAIDNGTVLRIGRPRDLLVDLSASLSDLRRNVPNLRVVLGFDCILRREALAATGRLNEAATALAGSGLFAFSTYGEQIGGAHINQTLAGVALGE